MEMVLLKKTHCSICVTHCEIFSVMRNNQLSDGIPFSVWGFQRGVKFCEGAGHGIHNFYLAIMLCHQYFKSIWSEFDCRKYFAFSIFDISLLFSEEFEIANGVSFLQIVPKKYESFRPCNGQSRLSRVDSDCTNGRLNATQNGESLLLCGLNLFEEVGLEQTDEGAFISY